MKNKGKLLRLSLGALLLIALAFLVAFAVQRGKNPGGDPIAQAETALNLKFPASAQTEIQGFEAHSTERFIKISIPEADADAFLLQVSRAAHWQKGAMPDDVKVFIYDGIYGGIQYSNGVAKAFGIPQISAPHWLFDDRGAGDNSSSFLPRSTYNLVFALYDEAQNALYYYETNR